MRRTLLHDRHAASAATLLPLLISAAMAMSGCGGAPYEGAEDASSFDQSKKEAAAPAPQAAPGHMLRSEVDLALSQGPSWLLRRVVPDPVIWEGQFVGWRIISMPEEWASTGITAGDVVTGVNGAAIERPDDLWKAWVALMTAPELKISYEHDGAKKELVMPIDGPPTLTEASLQAKVAPPTTDRRQVGRRETIVIQGSEPATDGATADPPK